MVFLVRRKVNWFYFWKEAIFFCFSDSVCGSSQKYFFFQKNLVKHLKLRGKNAFEKEKKILLRSLAKQGISITN